MPFTLSVSLLAQPADLRVRQLSPEGSAFTDNESLSYTRISSDGKWVVTWVDANTDNVDDLYAIPRFGGAPRRLSALRPAGSAGVVSSRLLLTPDHRRVVFALDQETLGRTELWSVPIEGPAAAAVKLSPAAPLDAALGGGIALSADGEYVGFLFNSVGAPHEVWSAPSDGSGAPFKLHGSYPPGASGLLDWKNSGGRAVFIADLAVAGRFELWSAPMDGSAAVVRLNGSLIAGGNVADFQFSSDGQRVYYFADQRVDEQVELYSVPIAGPFSAAERLNPDLTAAGDVTYVMDDASSSRVFFLADSTTNDKFELWSAPVAGPAASAVKLNGPLVAGGNVQEYFSILDGQLAYVADATVDEVYEGYVVPIAGPSQAGVRVNADLPTGADVSSLGLFEPEGAEAGPIVLLAGDLRVDGKNEIFVGPIDGSSAPLPLFPNPPAGQGFIAGCGLGLALDPMAIVLCADAAVVGRTYLYSAPVDLSAQPQVLNGFGQLGSDVTELEVDPTGHWVAFRHDAVVDNQFGLYRARTDGSGNAERVHGTPFAAGGDIAEPNGFSFTPDGYGIVYLADHDVDEKLELWISDAMVFRGDFEAGDLAEWSSTAP